jgi:hypothetical protein
VPFAEVPYVVEVWAELHKEDETFLTVYVNRTPVTGDIDADRSKRDIDAFGCGLSHTIAQAPVERQFSIEINLITPYMPITSDGKEPNLRPFVDTITSAVGKAIKKAFNPSTTGKLSIVSVVLDHLDEATAAASGDGEYRFNVRQVFYVLRPIVMGAIGKELKIENYSSIITDYQREHGEIPGMYREPRGSIYHPHRGETISLGTLMVEEYERPVWTFNKLLYIEKEGFQEALKAVRWGERHDCALISSKGFTTRAVRDLVDKLAEHDEDVTIFCAHDADGYGSMIYQTFQEATKARGARKIKIVNIGLEPWEAIEMGLRVETVSVGKRRKAVADYIKERDDGERWEGWLQTHRVELNEMTTPQFIEWLDSKMAAYGSGKLIPPADVLVAELDERIESKSVRLSPSASCARQAWRIRSPRPSTQSKSLLPRLAGMHCVPDLGLIVGTDPVGQRGQPLPQVLPEGQPAGHRHRHRHRTEAADVLVGDLAGDAAGFQNADLKSAVALTEPDEHRVVAH